MQLFSREKPKSRSVNQKIDQETEPQPLDPIALCLALWLGTMVCGFGLVRLMDDAAQRAAAADQPAASQPTMHPMGFRT